MKLSKSDSLFLYSFLFQISGGDWDSQAKSQIANLMGRIEEYLTGDDVACCQDDDVCVVVGDEDDEEDGDVGEGEDGSDEGNSESGDVVHHFLVSAEDLQELPPLNVRNDINERVTVQFEDVDFENAVDVLINEGSILLPEISSIKVTEKSVDFHDGDDWHSFSYKKLSKAWSDMFKLDYVYGVGAT